MAGSSLRYRALTAASIGAVVGACAAASGQVVTLIPYPPGAVSSTARGINQNGTVVVGHYNGYEGAFRWTTSTGVAVLPPPSGYTTAYATGVSRDGLVVAGSTGTNPNVEGVAGFRWTAASSSTAIGPFAYGGAPTRVHGVSGNGTLFYGQTREPFFGNLFGFKWTSGLPLIMPSTAADGVDAEVRGATPDGGITVGTFVAGLPIQRAAVWDGFGLTDLGAIWTLIPFGLGSSHATCVSDNGQLVWGHADGFGPAQHAARWLYGGGTAFLVEDKGHPPSYSHVNVNGCNSNGTAIIADGYNPPFIGTSPQLWSTTLGWQDLNVFLPAIGVFVPPGVTLINVSAISADGTAMCGAADLNGQSIAYVARNIPCLERPNYSGGTYGVQNVCPGGSAIAIAAVNSLQNEGTIHYQWHRNGVPISDGVNASGSTYSGTNSPAFQVFSISAADVATYTCILSNECGQVTSLPMHVVLDGPPSAPFPLVAQEACPGGSATFGIYAENAATYQWEYYNGFSGYVPFPNGAFNDFVAGFGATASGAQTDTLTLTNVNMLAPAVSVRVQIANQCASLAPIQAWLYPTATPVMAGQPATVNYCHGSASSFYVSANSLSPLSFQWQVYDALSQSWMNILFDGFFTQGPSGYTAIMSGVGTPILSVNTLTVGNVAPNLPYRCVISTDCTSVTSAAANLHICIADVNCDGIITSQDFFDFLTAFFTNSFPADVNTDNMVNSQDYFDFLTVFFTGC